MVNNKTRVDTYGKGQLLRGCDSCLLSDTCVVVSHWGTVTSAQSKL